MRYFISYDNYKNNSSLNKNIDIFSNELNAIYDKGDDNYIIRPLKELLDSMHDLHTVNDIDKFIEKTEKKRKKISFMIELSLEEANKVHPIFLKRFKESKLTNPDKTIKLLELDSYTIKSLKREEEEYLKSINLESVLYGSDLLELSINEINKPKKYYNIGEGEYYYTEKEKLLDKFKNYIVEIEEVDRNKYKLKQHKLITIDSIGRDRLIGLSREVCEFYYKICNESKVLYIDEDDNIIINDIKDETKKKVFVLDKDMIPYLINNDYLDVLYKYVNIYELKDSNYTKIPFEKYKKELKYIKKPSKN